MKFNLTTDKDSYRIDFTIDGKRKRFYPGTKDELVARQIHKQMVYEWETGQFDLSLQSYKLKNRQQTQTQLTSKENTQQNTVRLLELWDRWVVSLNLPARTLNNHYHCCRVMIKKAGETEWDDVSWFLASNLSASTWNIRRRFIKSCVQWAIDKGLVTGKNPWNSLKPRKSSKSGANPLTDAETAMVIQAFETDQFCSKYSSCKHSHYTPILKFLLLTAVRPGEAIALQWKHVDFDHGLIDVSEAMGRDLEASPYSTRKIRKETKTGDSRYLPLTPALKSLLRDLKPSNAKLDALVFPGVKGRTMDTRAFGRVWKQVLNGLGLEYRNPYQTRHTSLSHIAQNHGLLAAAKIAGHKSLDMVSRHYARYTGDLADVMPDFGQS